MGQAQEAATDGIMGGSVRLTAARSNYFMLLWFPIIKQLWNNLHC